MFSRKRIERLEFQVEEQRRTIKQLIQRNETYEAMFREVRKLTVQQNELNQKYDDMCKILHGKALEDYFTKDNIPDYCKSCSNHPSNGGSGICHCTLGSMTIC